MSSETTTQKSIRNICKSKGCENETRLRPFKNSVKLYSEKRCGVCMATLRRYGITGPERDWFKSQKIPLTVAKGAPFALSRVLGKEEIIV